MTTADVIDTTRKEMTVAELNGVCSMAALIAARTGLEALDAIISTPSPFVRSALFAGLVVNYARAFEPANARGSRLTRSFSIRGIEGFDRAAHEALLTLRNQYLAHAGYSQNDYTLMFVKISLHPEEKIADDQPFAVLGLGTRGQASIVVNVASQDGLRAHLTSLLKAAGARLAAAIKAHNQAFLACEAAGEAFGPGRLEGRLLASGSGQFGAPLTIPHDALLVANPTVLDALPLEFVSLFFSLKPAGPGQVELISTIKTHMPRPKGIDP